MKKTMALAMAGLMVLVAISISANAAVQQQQALPTQGSSNGSLAGKVLDGNSDPIEGAIVRIVGGYINFEDFEFAILLDKEDSVADGSYGFDVSSGKYTMLVTKEGYLFGFRYTVVSPGETVIENFHLISKNTGSYGITARVEDVSGEWSEWSDPLSVTMPRNRAINTPFQWFLQQHPILYQLLLRFLRL